MATNNFIKKITPLDSDTTYTINDPILNEVIYGTQTVVTGTWTGKSNTINALYNGLQIRYYLPYNGSGNATLNLTLADGTLTGAINCYYKGNTRLTTHYSAGDVINLTYFAAGQIKVAGTATTDARWVANANYDSGNTNTQIRVYRQTSGYNDDYPILVSRTLASSIGTAGTNDSYAGVYGVIYNANQPTINPATGDLKASNFIGPLEGTASQAISDANGNVISSTYVKNTLTHTVTTPTGATSRTADVALNTTTVNSITAVGTLPALTITSTACDDITSWSAGTMFTATVDDEVLTFTAGTAPSLAYTARTVGSASGWSAGTLPTKGADTTVATTIKTQPTFTVTTQTTTLSHTTS